MSYPDRQTAEEWAFIIDYIAKIELNDYDLLVQLGDAWALPTESV